MLKLKPKSIQSGISKQKTVESLWETGPALDL